MESKLLEEKVQIKSIANWGTAAPRILGSGDIVLQPNGVTMVSRDELINQSQRGNRLINGTDGKGSHATWIILDDITREELMFEEWEETETPTGKEDDGKSKTKSTKKRKKILSQLVVTKEVVDDIFAEKQDKTFETRIEELVTTRAEKIAFMNLVRKLTVNDYDRIRFCEDLTGIRR